MSVSTIAIDYRTKYELPEHLKKMRGILAGVEDKDDERLQYLLEKYK